jgi:hypothetical protein
MRFVIGFLRTAQTGHEDEVAAMPRGLVLNRYVGLRPPRADRTPEMRSYLTNTTDRIRRATPGSRCTMYSTLPSGSSTTRRRTECEGDHPPKRDLALTGAET